MIDKLKFSNATIGTIIIGVLLLCLVPLLYLPIGELLFRCLVDSNGQFIGLKSFATFFATPGLSGALLHTLGIGLAVTTLTMAVGFVVAYGLACTNMPCKRAIGSLAMLPMFVPSLLPALGLIYLLGEQGIAKFLLCGHSLYGPIGIILGGTIFALPHAIMLLRTAFAGIDDSLHVAATSLGASPLRRFFTITLPNAKYGIISSAIAVFILTITDFGVPKVVGGDFSMLATEIYILVIGQHNFAVGSATSLILLIPSAIAVLADLWARKRQRNLPTRKSSISLAPHAIRDFLFCLASILVELVVASSIAIVAYASFVSFWPYDLSFSLANYDFESIGFSWLPLLESLKVASLTAIFGCTLLGIGAYAVERLPGIGKSLYRLSIMLPLGLPGTTLGLAYLFAFSHAGMPWSFLYGTAALLAMNCIIHFSTVVHMNATGMFAKLDSNYEIIGASLGRSVLYTFCKVIAPLSKGTFIDIAFYLFVSAMSTVSAVVFLCDGSTMLASIGIVSMNDSGNIGSAAAMGTLILSTTLLAAAIHSIFRPKSS